MSGSMICLAIVLLLGAMFALIYAIDRSSKAQTRTGKPSRLVRISAVAIGLVGMGADFWLEWRLPWFILPLSLVLLGYGIFGWFATVKPRPTDGPRQKMGAPDSVSSVPKNGLGQNTKIIIGCGMLFILLICAGAGYFVYSLRDPGVLDIEAKYPETVQVGDGFELTLDLKSKGETDIDVQDIDLSPNLDGNYDSILVGATTTRTEPAMPSTELPQVKMRAYHYNRIVKPGETLSVILYLQAVKAGEFHTDIDVYLSDARTCAGQKRRPPQSSRSLSIRRPTDSRGGVLAAPGTR